MQVVARHITKVRRNELLTSRQRSTIMRIKALMRNPSLSEWQRQHLKALLDLPLN
jgi:hypothetical protein